MVTKLLPQSQFLVRQYETLWGCIKVYNNIRPWGGESSYQGNFEGMMKNFVGKVRVIFEDVVQSGSI